MYKRQDSKKKMEKVYFERQVGAQCGLHALNNLLVPHGVITKKLTETDMTWHATQIIQTEENDEKTPTQIKPEWLLNKWGNYNSDVIAHVIQSLKLQYARMLDIDVIADIINQTKKVHQQENDILGFILSNGKHWWTLRRIWHFRSGKWRWESADSLEEAAERLSSDDLEELLANKEINWFMVSRINNPVGFAASRVQILTLSRSTDKKEEECDCKRCTRKQERRRKDRPNL
jgi:hypothetical protein